MTLSRMTLRAGLAAGALVFAGALRAQEPSANAPLTTAAPHGFELRGTALAPEGDGLRAHGRLCRVSGLGPWPSRVKLALLAPAGEVVSDAVASIGPISPRRVGCVVYTVSSHWLPQAGQSVRLSAS